MENLVLLVISTTMANMVHVMLVIALAGISKNIYFKTYEIISSILFEVLNSLK